MSVIRYLSAKLRYSLDEWSGPESCALLSKVQLEAKCIQGPTGQAALLNIFINHLDDMTECTLSKVANDTNLGQISDNLIFCMLCCHSEGHGQTIELGREYSHEVKRKWKVLHMNRNNPINQYVLQEATWKAAEIFLVHKVGLYYHTATWMRKKSSRDDLEAELFMFLPYTFVLCHAAHLYVCVTLSHDRQQHQ